jgi:hypothetical protein
MVSAILGAAIRMDLERKHTQLSLEFSRRFVGPDRADVAKRSNDVGPQVDDAIHGFARERTNEHYVEYIEIQNNARHVVCPRAMDAGSKRRSFLPKCFLAI